MKLRLTNDTTGASFEGDTYGTTGNDVFHGERPEAKKSFFVMVKETQRHLMSNSVTKIIEDKPRRVLFEDRKGVRWRFEIIESINPVEMKKA